MTAPLEVHRVKANESVCIFVASSLLEALLRICKSGPDKYVVRSLKTGNERAYQMKPDGELVFVQGEMPTPAGQSARLRHTQKDWRHISS